MSDALTQARELSTALQELHRALIRSEIGDDPALQNPYTVLFALIGAPRFAWMGVLSRLITSIDEATTSRSVEPGEVASALPGWYGEAGALIGVGDGAPDPQFRMMHLNALQLEPTVGLATGRLRRLLGDRPAAGR